MKMKRNRALRTMAASLAAVCLLSAASCSLPGMNNGSGNGSTAEKPKQTASDVITHSYRAEQFGNLPNVAYVSSITRLGNTDNVLVVGNDDNGVSKMFITDLSFESFKEIETDYEKGENSELYSNIAAALDGTI